MERTGRRQQPGRVQLLGVIGERLTPTGSPVSEFLGRRISRIFRLLLDFRFGLGERLARQSGWQFTSSDGSLEFDWPDDGFMVYQEKQER